MSTMDYYQMAEKVLYDLWYEYAERLVEEVIKACNMTGDQALAFRQIYLRPNEFMVVIKWLGEK